MPKRVRSGERYLLAVGEELPGKERYRVQAYLGQGSFAAAYQAVNPAGEVCFLKEYFPAGRPSEVAQLHRVYATERDVIRRIGNYELIPRFWDAFAHEGFSYIVTDYIPGPDLETVLASGQRPDRETLIRWCVCLCHEIAFLHSRSVVHHDLKPANIRLNEDGDPVIVDFSAAHWYRMPGETTDQLFGSDSYLAPEYADRGVEDAEAGMKMDVFAMGRILVELMVGKRLTQEEIDRRHDQIYGELLHGDKVDVSFLRAVFRSVAYDPERRYSSGIELDEEITPAARPVGRVRPKQLDFGSLPTTEPVEASIQAFNVGGGTLRAEIATDAAWLEVGTSGAVTGPAAMFERNRQTVRVVAYPERVPAGQDASGRIVFLFPGEEVVVPVHLGRGAEAAVISVEPSSLRISVPPNAAGQGRLTFVNGGDAPARVQLVRPPDVPLQIAPAEFALGPRMRQEVTFTIEPSVVGDRELSLDLRWLVDGNPRAPIPVSAAIRGAGLLSSLTGRFRKK